MHVLQVVWHFAHLNGSDVNSKVSSLQVQVFKSLPLAIRSASGAQDVQFPDTPLHSLHLGSHFLHDEPVAS